MNLQSYYKYFASIGRVILGIVFIYSSYEKILQPGEFAVAVDNYRILPYELVNIFAIFLPWLEFFCGVALMLGFYWRTGALLVGLMLVTFIIALTSALIRRLDIDCGCFGVGQSVSIWRIFEDIVLLVLAFMVYRSKTTFAALQDISIKKR